MLGRSIDLADLTHIFITHGHIDHVCGSGAFIHDAESNNHPRPDVIGHENVVKRFRRYNFTDGYNTLINLRQTSQVRDRVSLGSGEVSFLDKSVAWPNIPYSDRFSIKIGELTFNLYHAKGETDDHTWLYIPEKKTICAGDFFIWRFPNAGNPQKAQRYPLEWCQTLREMAGIGAEYFVPAHGWPIRGVERIRKVCLETADVLDKLVHDTIEMMNRGYRLNEIIHAVKVSEDYLAKPFLYPQYDEPEFIINNIWRLYGGWYDGNPANLKPARDTELAAEISEISGGAEELASQAKKVAERGDLRLACHLVEMAYMAEPENKKINRLRAEIYGRRKETETSLMARAIFHQAEMNSRKIAEKNE